MLLWATKTARTVCLGFLMLISVPSSAEEIRQVIGPGGGEVVTPGGISLTLPSGALAEETELVVTIPGEDAIRGLIGTWPSDLGFVGAVHVEAGGVTFGAPVTAWFPLPDGVTGDDQLLVGKIGTVHLPEGTRTVPCYTGQADISTGRAAAASIGMATDGGFVVFRPTDEKWAVIVGELAQESGDGVVIYANDGSSSPFFFAPAVAASPQGRGTIPFELPVRGGEKVGILAVNVDQGTFDRAILEDVVAGGLRELGRVLALTAGIPNGDRIAATVAEECDSPSKELRDAVQGAVRGLIEANLGSFRKYCESLLKSSGEGVRLDHSELTFGMQETRAWVDTAAIKRKLSAIPASAESSSKLDKETPAAGGGSTYPFKMGVTVKLCPMGLGTLGADFGAGTESEPCPAVEVVPINTTEARVIAREDGDCLVRGVLLVNSFDVCFSVQLSVGGKKVCSPPSSSFSVDGRIKQAMKLETLAPAPVSVDLSPPEDEVRLTESGGNVTPAIAVDSQGHSHVAWKRDGKILYAKIDKGGVMLVDPVEIYGATPASLPRIVVDSSGNAHVVCGINTCVGIIYIKIDSGGQKLFHRLVCDPGVPLQSSPSYQWPSIAVDPKTDLPVVGALVQWTTSTSGGSILYPGTIQIGNEQVAAFRLDAEGKVTSKALLSAERQPFGHPLRSDRPSIAVDTNGTVHGVWRFKNTDAQQGDGHTYVAYQSSLRDAAGEVMLLLSDPGEIGDGATDGPLVVCDPVNSLYAAWRSDGGGGRVWLSRLSTLGHHEASGAVSPEAARPVRDISLACTESRVWLAWTDERHGQKEAYCGQIDSARLKALNEYRVTQDPERAFNPAIGIVPDGPTMVAWQDYRFGDSEILLSAVGVNRIRGRVLALKSATDRHVGAWDEQDRDEARRTWGAEHPVILTNAFDRLSNWGNFRPVRGLVADGVTPLVFRLDMEPGDYELSVALVGEARGDDAPSFLMKCLRVYQYGDTEGGVEGEFQPMGESSSLVIPEQDGQGAPPLPGLAYIAGFDAGDFPWDGEREKNVELVVASEEGDEVMRLPFTIRKPPVVLVHGYNGDASGWYEDYCNRESRFIDELVEKSVPEFVRPVEYGVRRRNCEEADLHDNTASSLIDCSVMLDRELKLEEARFRAQWAMTRYDVVGHSQGGVLARMLCRDTQPGSEALGFVSRENWFRGRFRRVITIGSPHNGSTLGYYMDQGAQRKLLVPWLIQAFTPLLQPKFLPFSDREKGPGEVARLQTTHPVHPNARFRFISTEISYEDIPFFVKSCLKSCGLTKENYRLVTQDVVDNGGVRTEYEADTVGQSDGVVNTVSHRAWLPIDADGVSLVNPGTGIAHAKHALFGAGADQCQSNAAASEVASALNAKQEAKPFVKFPENADEAFRDDLNSLREVIDDILTGAQSEAARRRRDLLGRVVFRVAPIPGTSREEGSTLYSVELDAPDDLPVLDEIVWHCEAYGRDGPTTSAISVTFSQESPHEAIISVGEDVEGDVVVLAVYESTDGVTVHVSQALVVSRPFSERTGLTFGMEDMQTQKGHSFWLQPKAEYADGTVAPFFDDPTVDSLWQSSDTGIATVSDLGRVSVGSELGTADITFRYDGMEATLSLEVVNMPPEVALTSPLVPTDVLTGSPLELTAEADDWDGDVAAVDFYANDSLVERDEEPPYATDWQASEPGVYAIRVMATDSDGASTESASVTVTAASRAPTCVWAAKPVPDEWYSGSVTLEAEPNDSDVGDTLRVEFQHSLDSTDGTDGAWSDCGPPVGEEPYAMTWDSQPADGVDQDVWLRVRAVDQHGTMSLWATRRIKVDNAYQGVQFEPHPGATGVAVDSDLRIRFQFEGGVFHGDGSAVEVNDLPGLLSLTQSGTNVAFGAAMAMPGDGYTVVTVTPEATLAGVTTHVLAIVDTLTDADGNQLPRASTSFTTSFGTPGQLQFRQQPAGGQAGVPWTAQPRVAVCDAQGNTVTGSTAPVTVALAGTDGTLHGTTTLDAVEGVASFSDLWIDLVGEYTLTATSPDLASGESALFSVGPGTVDHFTVQGVADPVRAHTATSATVVAYDAFGNVKSDYTGAVSFSSSDPSTELPLPYAFYAAENGVHTFGFRVVFHTPGEHWLRVADGAATGTQSNITVTNGAPEKPSPVSPANGGYAGVRARLAATAFSDRDGSDHAASQWQVATDAEFADLVWDTGDGTPMAATVVPDGLLSPLARYFWRVRYKDDSGDAASCWSAWSDSGGTAWCFTTTRPIPFADDFSEDNGWTGLSDAGWQRGPAAMGGGENGLPDPETDHTGGDDNAVLGYAIAADYPGTMAAAEVVSPPLDCTGHEVVELSFWRWLGVDENKWAGAGVLVSSDGWTWTPLWQNAPAGVSDGDWIRLVFDITPVAANRATVFVKFVMGPMYDALPFCGWNIDDVRVGTPDTPVLASAWLETDSAEALVGDEIEVRLYALEHSAEARGFRGGPVDVFFDHERLGYAGSFSSANVVQSPFNALKTSGALRDGMIDELGGVSTGDDLGDGEPFLYAKWRMRAESTGTAELRLAPGDSGFSLAPPVGPIDTWRVSYGEPVTVRIVKPEIPPPATIKLVGPGEPICVGDVFDIEVYLREDMPGANGVLGGPLDVNFDPASVRYAGEFDADSAIRPPFKDLGITSGSVATGRIDELGGLTLGTSNGDGQFILYAVLAFESIAETTATFSASAGESGIALSQPVGQLSFADIDYGVPVQVEMLGRPRARLSSLPPEATSEASVQVDVGGYRLASYRYRLDDGEYGIETDITSPIVLEGLREGTHTLSVLGKNADGVWQETEAGTLAVWLVDLTPPTAPALSGALPFPGSVTASPDVELEWTSGSDGLSGLAGYLWRVNQSPDTIMATGAANPAPPAAVELGENGDGQYWLHVCAVDVAGNQSASVHCGPWVMDTTPPVSRPGGPYQLIAAGELDGGNSSDDGSGIVAWKWEIESPPGSDGFLSSYDTPQTSFSGTGNGTYVVRLTVTDAAGLSSAEDAEVFLNRAAPTLHSVTIEGGAEETNRRLVAVALDIDPGGASVLHCRLGEAPGEGEWRVLNRLGPGAVTVDHLLSEGDGQKTVYVTVRDGGYPYAGYTSTELSDDIDLDANSWQFSFSLTGANTELLRIGMQHSTTDGFDEGVDVNALMAGPGEGAVYGYHAQHAYWTDIRAVSDEAVWGLVATPGSTDVTLTWAEQVLPMGNVAELVEIDATGQETGEARRDLMVAGELAIPKGGTHYYEVRYGRTQASDVTPTVDLNGDREGVDWAAVFTEDGGPVLMADPSGLSVRDMDSLTFESATITITNVLDGASERLSVDVVDSGLTADYNSVVGVLSLSGTAPAWVYEAALRTATYDNTSQAPTSAERLVTFVVSDGDADGPAATCSVTVVGVNDPPAIAGTDPVEVTMSEDGDPTPFSLELNATDDDDDQLTWTIKTQAANGVASVVGTRGAQSIDYAPTENWYGPDSFVVEVDDGLTGTAVITVNVTVESVNDLPAITGEPELTVTVGDYYEFVPGVTDVEDTDGFVFECTGQPAWADFDTATGQLSGTPAYGDLGTYENIVISVTDQDSGETSLGPFDIIVANIPTATVRGVPPGRTRQADYSIQVGGASIVTYRWKLDDGDWQGPTAVAEPIVLSGLAEGSHRLLVLGKNDLGKEQPEEAATAVAWVMDLTPPVAELINAPAATTNSASLNVRVGGAQVRFYKYKLDTGDWSASRAVSVAISATGLTDGAHTLAVIGSDAAGNWQTEGSTTTTAWTVNTSLPYATLANVPRDLTDGADVSVKVGGDAVVAYRYMIDAPLGSSLPGEWSSQQPVGVPIEFDADVDGDYTLVVNGRNALGTWQDGGAGNAIDRATSHAWTLDRTPPAQLADLEAGLGLPPTSVVELQWTPPGGDAVRYEIRYAKAPWNTWENATPVYVDINPSDPAEVEKEVFRIRRLAAKTGYVFAVRAIGAAGNAGAIATVAETTADARPAILDFGIGDGLVKEADNSAACDLRVIGQNFVSGEANTVRFVATGRSFDVPTQATSTAATLDVTVPAGVPVGSYNLRVINANGRSILSVDTYTVLAAPAPLPEVTHLDPPMAAAGYTTDLRIGGAHLAEATKIELVTGGAVAFTHDGAMTATAYSIEVSLALPDTLDPGLYHVRVTADGRTNEVSAVRLEVYAPIDIGDADGSTVASRGVDMPDDGRVPVGLELTSGDGGAASDSEAVIRAAIPPDTQISLSNGQPYTGTVNPPREVPVTDEIADRIENGLGFDADSAVVFTMGSATERLELGEGQAMFVSIEISLPAAAGAPSIYYLEADGTLTLAGVPGVHNGIAIVPGGTVLESKPDSPEPGYTSYVVGVFVDHMSTYAVSGESMSIALDLSFGWNLLSLPFGLSDEDTPDQVIADVNGTVLHAGTLWAWNTDDDEYISVSRFTGGQGFWALRTKTAPATTDTIYGAPTRGAALALAAGWNLVGPTEDTSAADVYADENVWVIWRWDVVGQRYEFVGADKQLVPGVAYWIYK